MFFSQCQTLKICIYIYSFSNFVPKLLQGDCKKVQNLSEMIQGLLPEGCQFCWPEPAFDRRLVAVLCPVKFEPNIPASQCGHWVPGWYHHEVEELENAKKVSREKHNDTLTEDIEELKEMLDETEDPDEVTELMDHLNGKQEKAANLRDFFEKMNSEHSILTSNVQSDGNCGPAMFHIWKTSAFDSKDLDDQIIQGIRDELKGFWAKVASSETWQTIWQGYCQGRVDLKKWIVHNQHLLSPKKRQRRKVPFSPDQNPNACKALVPGGGDEPTDSITIPGLHTSDEKPSKKKRTGKALPPERKITFPIYFQRWCSDRGITYRRWVNQHRQSVVIVSLS